MEGEGNKTVGDLDTERCMRQIFVLLVMFPMVLKLSRVLPRGSPGLPSDRVGLGAWFAPVVSFFAFSLFIRLIGFILKNEWILKSKAFS